MTSHRPARASRVLARTAALTPAAAVLALAGTAHAAAPDQWAPVEPVAPLEFLLVLVLIPAGLFLLIALLSSIGSMARSESSYQPGLAWRNEPEWFGGPRGGLDKVDDQRQLATGDSASEQGGASGRW